MTRRFIIGMLAASSIAVSTPAIAAQAGSIPELEQSYLQKAAERHQAEVALGQLTLQKASSDQVKQYGARMIQDHQRAIEDVQRLIRKEGELSMPHQQIQRKLSELSGKDFDKAYMAFMVRDHMKDLGELQQRAATLTDPRVQHWMEDTLHILKEHLEQAKLIAAAIGVTAKDEPKVQEDSTSQ
jgi:putative membrane protein